jgi:hypothetical protein
MRQSMSDRLASKGRAAGQRASGSMPAWLSGLAAIPGAGVLVDAVRSWWAQHPLRVAALVAIDASKTLLLPLARRNPVGLVVGALVVGGVIAWVRPWRGILKPALFAGLLPQLIAKAMAHVPVESWLSVLSAFAAQQTDRRADPAPSPSAEAPETPEPAPSPSPLH